MFRSKGDRQFRIQATPDEIAFASFLTIYDLLSIVDKETAKKVAQRIRRQALKIDAIAGIDSEKMTVAGVESVRRLFVEACR